VEAEEKQGVSISSGSTQGGPVPARSQQGAPLHASSNKGNLTSTFILSDASEKALYLRLQRSGGKNGTALLVIWQTIKFGLLSIRSLTSKVLIVNYMISDYNLTETWLKTNDYNTSNE